MKTGNFIISILVVFFVSGCIPRGIDIVSNDEPLDLNLCGPTTTDLETKPGIDGKLIPLFRGLDVYHFPISTKSELAQQYFDQGFFLSYSFNHAEVSYSFREAIRQDPDCAMCFWGLGYVLGTNYNNRMEDGLLVAANEAVANAKLRMHNATPKEQALILALEKRCPKSKEQDPVAHYMAYAEAMKNVAKQFPMDVNIAAMTAEAIMDLNATHELCFTTP